jgi:hypothetical protein
MCPSQARGCSSKVPSHCTSPGPNGRFDFNPEVADLRDFTVDGRQVYYEGKTSIRRHTLPSEPSYAPPANDSFENAQSVTVGLYSTARGVTSWATVQPGEPLANVKQTIWYTFTPATSGPLEVDIARAERNTGRFGVYTGSSLATLTPVAGPVSLRTDRNDGHVQFNAVAGQQYWIDVGTSDPQADFRQFFVNVSKP